MHRVGDLWPEFRSWKNLVLAARKARKRKRSRPNVQAFEFDREYRLRTIQSRLDSETWYPGPYHTFEIRDPKPRLISAAPYADRIVHHALCNVIEPVFDRRFIFDSYACRRGKGTHAALDRASAYCRRFPFVLKLDVKQYFPSIDHQVLLQTVSRSIKDKRILQLCERIVCDYTAPQSEPSWFPGDDLLTLLEKQKGLPIGNQTSQLFGNVMLDPLDHFVKERLRVSGYVRYADDMLVYGESAVQLHALRDEIQCFLFQLRLRINTKKCQIFPCRNGIPFLGARLFPGHRLMSRRLIRRFRQRARLLQSQFRKRQISLVDIQPCVVSWLGHARHLAGDAFVSNLLQSLRLTR